MENNKGITLLALVITNIKFYLLKIKLCRNKNSNEEINIKVKSI